MPDEQYVVVSHCQLVSTARGTCKRIETYKTIQIRLVISPERGGFRHQTAVWLGLLFQ